MATVTAQKSQSGGGHSSASTTVKPGDQCQSSSGAVHVIGTFTPKRIFELPGTDLRCDN